MHYYLTVGATLLTTYIFGSLYYLVVGKSWRKALGWKENEQEPYRPKPLELVVAFILQFILVVCMFWVFNKLQPQTLSHTLSYGFLIWFGLILPTLSTNVVFQRRNVNLILIDGSHWLLLLLIISAMYFLFS